MVSLPLPESHIVISCKEPEKTSASTHPPASQCPYVMSPSSSNSYLKDSPPLKKRKVGSQPKKIYKQSFRDEWLSVPEYVQWIKKDNDKVKCTVCAITLLSKKSAIDDHVKTQRHVRLMAEKLDKKATKLTTFFNKNPVNTSRDITRVELKLAAWAAEHEVPFRALDHLPAVLASFLVIQKLLRL